MSVHLYRNRIYWDGRHGCVWADPYMLALTEAPALPGLSIRLAEIDYAPGVVAELREHAGGRRDMTAAEIEACDTLLRQTKEMEGGG